MRTELQELSVAWSSFSVDEPSSEDFWRLQGTFDSAVTKLSLLFESSSNLKSHLERFGRFTPSAQQAADIVTCLAQGREFLQIARSAPISTRPIVLYYGMNCLARALVVSYGSPRTLADVRGGHGLKTPDDFGVPLENLRVRTQDDGLFPSLMRILSSRSWFPLRLDSLKEDGDTQWFRVFPPETSASSFSVSMKEIFARVAGLEDLYEATFLEQPRLAPAHYSAVSLGNRRYLVILEIQGEWTQEDLQKLHPCLAEWHRQAPLANRVVLHNLPPGFGEFPRDWAELSNHVRDFGQMVVPLSRGPTAQTLLLGSLQGTSVTDGVVLYLGTYLLSSVARYRPDLWVRMVSPTAEGQQNRLRAAVEVFLDLSLRRFPLLVMAAIARRPLLLGDDSLHLSAERAILSSF